MNCKLILRTLLTVLLTAVLAGAASAQVSLRYDPENGTVGMEESQRVGIYLDDPLNVRTIELTVQYDDEYITSLGGGAGALYDALPPGTVVWDDFDNSTPGQWTGYAVSFSPTAFVTGPGELFYWDVEGLNPGEAQISTVSVAIYDDAGAPIADVTLDGTTLTVVPPIEDAALNPMPEYHAGTSNTATWNDVGATEYQVQVSTDSGFGTIFSDSGWITGTSHEFAGLTDGVQYFYRIRARLDSPAYETGWSTESVFSTPDDTGPQSAVAFLAPFQTSLTFDVPWSGSDAGSGLDRVELYVNGILQDTNNDPDGGLPFSYTAPAEGAYEFYTVAYDNVNNPEDVPVSADASTMVDVTAPSGGLVVNGGATVTPDQVVALASSVTDAVQMRFTNIEDDFSAPESAWQTYADDLSWTLTAGDGLKTVYGEYRDEAGNVLELQDDIVLDQTPPADSFVINDDDTYTNSTAVTLTNGGSDAVEMRFTNTENDWAAPESAWQTYAADLDWTIPTVEGEATVYAEYRDEAGNVSGAQESIIYDSIPPVADFAIEDGAVLVGDPLVDLTITGDPADVVEMRFRNASGSYESWLPFSVLLQDWELEAGDGLKTVYGQFRDAAGNEYEVSHDITLDTTPPVAEMVINGDDAETAEPAVVLDITNTDAVEMRFSNDGSVFSDWETVAVTRAWTLAGVEGVNTVYADFRDEAGNILSTSDTILLDTVPPAGALLINNGDNLTNDLNVILTSVINGAIEMRFSNDNAAWGDWVALESPYPWLLDDHQGAHTVYGQYRDSAGNVLDLQDSITVDMEAPTGTFVINDDDEVTDDPEVYLTIAVSGAVEMRFTNTQGDWNGPDSFWRSYAAGQDWTLDAVEGEKIVYAQFRDTAENILDYQDAIILDTTGPEAGFVINGDAAKTNITAVTLDITPGDAMQMQFSNDGMNYAAWQAADVSLAWNLEATEGERIVYGRFQDQAGNITEAQDAIVLDTTAPVATLLINGGDPATNQITVDLALDAPDAVEMRFRTGAGSYGDWEPFVATGSIDLEDVQGEQTVYGEFRDDVGNTSEASDTIIYDTGAPTGSFVINDDAAYTNTLAVTLQNSVAEAVRMQFSNDGVTYDAWEAYAATKEWTMVGTDGILTVYGRFEDEVGNVLETQDTIELDTAGPIVDMVINNGDPQTASTLVTLNITPTDAVEMNFANDGGYFSEWVPFNTEYTWELQAIDGVRIVSGHFRDAAGNISGASDSIILDTTAPDVPTLAPEPEFTLGVANSLSWNAIPEATYLLQRADDAAFSSGVVESGWIAETTFEFGGLTDGALFHYRVKAKDALDNETDWSSAESSTQDATAPESAVGTLAAYQTTLEFEVPWSGSDDTSGLSQVELFVDDGGGAVSAGVITDPVSPGVWSYTAPGEGTYSFYTRATDNVGLVEEAPAAPDAQTIVDMAGPDVSFVINEDADFTGSTLVTLNMTGAEAVEMQFANEGEAFADWVAYENEVSWTLNGPDGLLTVLGRFRDAAGNVTETSDSIILDTTAPDVPTLAPEPEFTPGVANSLSWNAIPEATYLLQRADDAAFSSGVVESGWIAETTFEFGGLTDGALYHYRVKAKDALDNETDWSSAESSTQDATAPESAVGTLAAYQTTLEFEVPWSGSDDTSGLSQVELFVDDGGGAVSAGVITDPVSPGAWSYTAPGEGTYSFYTRATDNVGLVEEAPAAPDAQTIVDVSLPTGGFVINDDATWTNQPDVLLTASVAEAQEMRFRNAGGAWSDWEAYAGTRSWLLDGPDGVLTVEGEFRDDAGNVLTAADDIQLDTQPPEGGMAINGGAEVTGTEAVVLNHSVTGAFEMRHSDDGSSWTDWVGYAAELLWNLPPGDGIKTVYGEFRDEADNTLALSDTIELDTTAPAVPVMNPEPAFTMGTTNLVSWTGEGATYLVEAATDPAFSAGVLNSGWIAGTAYEFTGLNGGQIYYYRVTSRDELENESSPSASVFSTQDDDMPEALAAELSPFGNSLEISVEWSGSDATSGLASATLYVDDGSGWTSHATTEQVDPAQPFTFTAPGDGMYGFQVVGTDLAGNVEALAAEAEASTLIDRVAPIGTLAINGGEESTGVIEVTLVSAVTDDLDIAGMRFSNESGVWPGGPDSWLPYAESHPWTLLEGDGTKTVFAEYQDAAGNILALSDTIELDTTPPGMPVLTAEPEFTPGTTNTLYWETVDAAAYYLQASEDEDFNTILAGSGWITALEYTFGDLTDGQTYFYRIRARDELDNETEFSAAVFSTQDATAPTSAAGELDPYQGVADIAISWSGEDLTSGLATIQLYVNDGMGWDLAAETTEIETPVPFVYTAPGAGEYSFYTLAIDQVGNVEAPPAAPDAVTTVDFSAPSPASDLRAQPGHDSISVSWTNPDDEDVELIEVWAALWVDGAMESAYPEYDDVAEAPARPGSRAAAEAAEGWALVQTLPAGETAFLHSEGMTGRGVYLYEIFVRDLAGNYSAPVAVNDMATNYRLGDIDNNHQIDVMDITRLGASYDTEEGDAAYDNELDLGPTNDGSGNGVPLTDNHVGFNDLAIMALNYGGAKAASPVEGSAEPALTWFRQDETTWVLGLTETCASLQAIQLCVSLPEDVTVTVTAGEALADEREYFLATSTRHGLDAGLAMLGQGRVVPRDGELLIVTTSSEVDLSQVRIEARDPQNESLNYQLTDEPIRMLPTIYNLGNNYPNPFNPQTTISFDLPEAQPVRLVIYDLKGRQVKELVSEPLAAGFHTVVWDGTQQQGRRVASGVYFYRISAGPLQETKRMMLVK